jgi:hypothetical protein
LLKKVNPRSKQLLLLIVKPVRLRKGRNSYG